jgi:hypothetical protein
LTRPSLETTIYLPGLVHEDQLAVGRDAPAFVDRSRGDTIWRVAKSCDPIWDRPPSRRTNAGPLPSGNGRAEALCAPSNVIARPRAQVQPVDRVPPRSGMNSSDWPSGMKCASVSMADDVSPLRV